MWYTENLLGIFWFKIIILFK